MTAPNRVRLCSLRIARICFFFGMTYLPSEKAHTQENRDRNRLPTPDELSKLCEASRQRYTTLRMTSESESFDYVNGKLDEQPKGEIEFTSISTPSRSYMRISMNDPTVTRQYAFSPTWSKRLETGQGLRARGIIEGGEQMKSEASLDPFLTVWKPLNSETLFRIDEAAEVSVEKDRGFFVLTTKWLNNPQTYKVAVDPNKDFLPVKAEILSSDGSLKMAFGFSDFRKTESGLWFPFKWSFEVPGMTKGVARITSLDINSDILDKELDFVFPHGTRVRDRIANLQYVVPGISMLWIVVPFLLAASAILILRLVRGTSR